MSLNSNRSVRDLFFAHVGQTSPSPFDIEINRAEGVFLYGPGGKRWFDLISGVSVSNTGHGQARVREAIKAQVDAHTHLMVYGEVVQAPQVRYAARLAELLPPGLDNVYFVNSGAEANEAALKLAKRATGRSRLISFRKAYHGSTHGALSVIGDEGEMRRAFRPLLPDTRLLDYNDFAALQHITSHTACVLMEPLQGEAGVICPAPGFLQAVRDRCTEVGALLIFDEIQTGFGRTGSLFAMQTYGVTPDMVTLAKALGGGMPLGALCCSRELMRCWQSKPVLGHITTFGGHPVCCAAGLAALELLLDSAWLEEVGEKEALFRQLLEAHPAVREVRGKGLLLAVELGSAERMYALMDIFLHQAPVGILSDWFLFCDTAFRISPPLCITPQEIREVCGIILACLDVVVGKENVGKE